MAVDNPHSDPGHPCREACCVKHEQSSRFRPLALAVLSGCMLGFAFPPSTYGILACFGLVPLLALLEKVDGWRSQLKYIYIAMVVFHAITLNWTGGYAHMNDPYMMIAGGVTILVHPFFYFLPLGAYLYVKRRAGWRLALAALPIFWVGYEYSHTLSEWSFPWLTLGNAQSYNQARIQIVEYTGVLGLSLWILLLNALGFYLYMSITRNGVYISRMNAVLVGLITILYIAPGWYGVIVLKSLKERNSAHPTVTVGIIQSNVDPWEKWERSGMETINLYMRMTDSLMKLPSLPQPDIVLWPETAMPYYILAPRNENTLSLVRGKFEDINVPVLFGLPQAVYYEDTTKAPPSAKRIAATGERYDAFNAAAFMQPGVPDIPWYGKMKMVPIAERVPYADAFYFFDFLRWGVGIGGWQIGRDTVVFREQKSGTQFCALICYESVYPEFVTEFVKRGAEFISIITIDSWWDRMSGAYQHHQYAIFRAVENRRWVARCAVGGFSSYIDPSGRVHEKTELFTQAVLSKPVERLSSLTFYTKYGDLIGRVCMYSGVLIVFGLFLENRFTTSMKT